MISYDMICLLTAIGLTPGGSSMLHIYTQTVPRTTQLTTRTIQLTTNNTIFQDCHNSELLFYIAIF